MVHASVFLCGRLTEWSNGHAAGNRVLRGTLRALWSMLLLHALGFLLKSRLVRQDYLLFVPGYAALELVTSYAAPWLRDVRVSPGSLQTWWSWRAAKQHAGSNQALRRTYPRSVAYSASARARAVESTGRLWRGAR